MIKKILLLEKIRKEGIKILNKKYILHHKYNLNKKTILSIIKNYDAIIVKSITDVDKLLIDNAKNLKLVARAGTGLDNIDISYLKKKKIKLVHTPLSSSESVADFTIMLILVSIRKYLTTLNMVSKLDFRRQLLVGRNLKDLVVGVIGYGNIGKLVVKRLKSFGAKILILDPKLKKNNLGLNTLLKQSDIITFHLPLTKKTKNMIGKKELKKMKNNVVLINTSRAEIFNEKFYSGSLKKFTLYTDVIKPEPSYFKANNQKFVHPWLKNKNIFFTPHIASMTYDAQLKISQDLVRKIIKKLN